jgi:hypothetical protein
MPKKVAAKWNCIIRPEILMKDLAPKYTIRDIMFLPKCAISGVLASPLEVPQRLKL